MGMLIQDDDVLGGVVNDADQVIMSDGKSVEETVSTLKTSLNNIGNITINDSSYVSSCEGSYSIIGRVCIFSFKYIMRTAINSSASGIAKGLPIALYPTVFLSLSENAQEQSDNNVRKVLVDRSGFISIKNAHSAGTTYTCSGAYIIEP